MKNEQINTDLNVEFAIAEAFHNGNKSVLKDELRNRSPIEAAKIVTGVVGELAMSFGDADYGTAEALDDVQDYLEEL